MWGFSLELGKLEVHKDLKEKKLEKKNCLMVECTKCLTIQVKTKYYQGDIILLNSFSKSFVLLLIVKNVAYINKFTLYTNLEKI